MTTTQEALKKELETLRTAFAGNSSEARKAPREAILNALIQNINSYKTPLTFEQFLNFHHAFCSKNFNLTQGGKKESAYQQFIQTMHRILDGYGKDLSIEEYGLLKNMLADPHCAFNEELKTRLSQIVSLGDGRYKVAFKSGLKEELETLKAALTANKFFSFGRRDAREKTLEELSTKINTYGNQLTFAQFLDFYSQFCSQDFKLTQGGNKEIAYQQFLQKMNGALHSCSKNLSVEEHAALKRDLENPACPFNEDLKIRLHHITTVDTKKYQPAFDLIGRFEAVKQACVQKRSDALDLQAQISKDILEKTTAHKLIIAELGNSVTGDLYEQATKLHEEINALVFEKERAISLIDDTSELANENITSLQNSRWTKGICDPTNGIFSEKFNRLLAVCCQMEGELGLTQGQNQLRALQAVNPDIRKTVERNLAALISCTQRIEIMHASPKTKDTIDLITEQKKLNDELLALVQEHPSVITELSKANFLPTIFTDALKATYLPALEEKAAQESKEGELPEGAQAIENARANEITAAIQAPLASMFCALGYACLKGEQEAIRTHLQELIQAHIEFNSSELGLQELEMGAAGIQRYKTEIAQELTKLETHFQPGLTELTENLQQCNAKVAANETERKSLGEDMSDLKKTLIDEYKTLGKEHEAICQQLETLTQEYRTSRDQYELLGQLQCSQLIRTARQNKDINQEVLNMKAAAFAKYLEETIKPDHQNAGFKQAVKALKTILSEKLGALPSSLDRALDWMATASAGAVPSFEELEDRFSALRDGEPPTGTSTNSAQPLRASHNSHSAPHDELEMRFNALVGNAGADNALDVNEGPDSVFLNTLKPLLIKSDVTTTFFNTTRKASVQAQMILDRVSNDNKQRSPPPFSITFSAFEKQGEAICAANQHPNPRERICLIKRAVGGEQAEKQAAVIYQFCLLLEKDENSNLLPLFSVEPLTASKKPGVAAEDAVVIGDLKRMCRNLARGVEIYGLQNREGEFAFRGELTQPGGQGERFVWAALDHMTGNPSLKSRSRLPQLIEGYPDPQTLGEMLDHAYQTTEAGVRLANPMQMHPF